MSEQKVRAHVSGRDGCGEIEFDSPDLPHGRSADWCVHFTGIFGPGMTKHTHCDAGVEYDAVKDATVRPFAWPCIRRNGSHLPCAARQWPTAEEVAQHEAYTAALIENLKAALTRDPGTNGDRQ